MGERDCLEAILGLYCQARSMGVSRFASKFTSGLTIYLSNNACALCDLSELVNRLHIAMTTRARVANIRPSRNITSSLFAICLTDGLRGRI